VAKDLTGIPMSQLANHLGSAVRIAAQEGPRIHTARRAETGPTREE
jgi:hypothetical protein